MILRKLLWGVNAVLHAPFFKQIRFPSYVGPLVSAEGLKNVTSGRRTRIYPGLRIETHGGGTIRIGEDVSVGQNFHITSGGDELVIGAHTTISGNVFITNIDHEYREIDRHIMEQKFLISHTAVGENCFIGYGAAIQAGTVLGRQCIVGANSVVRGIFPDYCVIVGAPARIVKRYDPERAGWYKTNPQGEFIS